MNIQTKEEFIKYCLRNLGAPVVNIDVTDEQIDDRFSEALKKMRDFNSSGYERVYHRHQITQTDRDNGYIDVPAEIDGVVRVFPIGGSIGSSFGGDPMFSIEYQIRLNDIWDMGTSSLSYFVELRQYTSMLDQLLSGSNTIIYRFNRVTNRVYIDIKRAKLNVGQYVMLECMVPINPDDYPELYDEPWFKEYFTALIKRQWGANLKKFTGVQMIGGVAIDGQGLYNEALQELEQLEQELRNVWEEPVAAFFIG